MEILECGLLFTVCTITFLPPLDKSASAFLPPVAASTSTSRTTATPKYTSVWRSPRTLPTSHSHCSSTHASCRTDAVGSRSTAASTS